jgi:hypothetical protein
MLPSNHVVFVVDIEKELKEKFDEKVAEKKKKGSKGWEIG